MSKLVIRLFWLRLAATLLASFCHAFEASGFNSTADERSGPESTSNSSSTEISENEDESDAERQAVLTNDRFLAMLRKQPKPGTALDRVYAFHLERGSRDQFLSEQRSVIAEGDANGDACLLVGLFETKRGHYCEAEAAFRLAEERRPQDATASMMLGRSLLELQRAEDAAMAFERAIERSPQKADLLLIYQDLGRAYRRSHQTEKANGVWQRVALQFPDDLRVKEQIARTLFEEGDLDAAIAKYDELAKQHRDPSQRTQHAITAANLKLQLGRQDEALHDFESQLQTLDPESWLARDVRQRIQQVFLLNNDQVGLVRYYETWLKNHPDDLNVMASLGHALTLQGRMSDALEWYRKALEKAPADLSLRKTLLAHLTREKLFDEATAEYEILHKMAPEDIQIPEAWGLMELSRDDRPLSERRANAIAIWQRILQAHRNEPRVIIRAAELIQRTERPDEALALYRRAVELSPQDPQYREYLGDYLQSLGRTDEAILAWEAMAEGDQRTTKNLIRLAEILHAAGIRDKALSAMQAACELTPEFNDHLKLARWFREYEQDGRSSKAVDALKQLNIAETLAESDEERRLILAERIQCLLAARQLDEAIRDLTLRLQRTRVREDLPIAPDAQKTAAEWEKLAAYLEAAKQLPDALAAVKISTELAPESVSSWELAARLLEQAGRYADTVEAYRKLLTVNQRARSQYLQKIANLEQRLGRRDEALKAGKQLLAGAPENSEFVKFYADLCFHFGDRQEALKTLRRAVRSSSADGALILSLARTLANQNEVEEATALCWTAFQKTAAPDDKASSVMMLAELALRSNRFDQLIEKLEQHGRESGQEQVAAHCLATAYRVAGDLRSARQTLETLLVSDRRDSPLLLQLSRLAEEDGDLEAAADYQRRANSVVASGEGEMRLANLLVRLGDLSEAEALWNRLAADASRPAEAIEAIDQLVSLESLDSAREICDRLLTNSPDNWEVLIRRGILEWRFGDRENAAVIFQRVLDLRLDSKTASVTLKAPLKQTDSGTQRESQRLPALARLERLPELVELLQESSPSSWFGSNTRPAMPHDYGAARMVAIIGRYLWARQSRSESAVLEQLSREAASGKLQAACDELALEMFVSDRNTEKLFADPDFKKFFLSADTGDIEAQAMLLESIARRVHVWEVDDAVESSIDGLPAPLLSMDQFLLLMNSFENVLTQRTEWLETFDAPRLFCICRHQQQLENLDKVIAGLLERKDAGPQLSMGIDLGLLRQTLSVQSALDAMSRKPGVPKPVNAAADDGTRSDRETDFELLSSRLLKIARRARIPSEDHPGLQVLDWWLKWRHEFRGRSELRLDPAFEHEVARKVIDGVLFSNRDLRSKSYAVSGDSSAAVKLGLRNLLTDHEFEFLTQVFRLLLRENSSASLVEWFNEKTESSEKAYLPEVELMQVVFWNVRENPEQVLLHLVRTIEESPQDNLLKLVVALRLEEMKLGTEAIELIGQLPDNDPLILKCREFKSLDLAKALQLSDVAKVSLTRLTRMDLSESELDYVFHELGRFGLEALSKDLELRRTKVRAEAIDASPLAVLDHYEQQGNLTAAVQVAQQLLRRSHQNPTPWRNTNRPTPEQIYARAYKVLNETGELEKMIERQKAQLAKSPHSGRLRKTLLDYLEAAGKTDEANRLRISWQKIQPGASADLMMTQAIELINAKQPQLACDRLLEVIQDHPAVFWRETTTKQVFAVFAETKRLAELGDAVLLADRGRSQSFAPTETLEELIKLLLQDPGTHAKAAELIQRYADMYPAYTVNFLMLVEQLPLWSSPDLFALLTAMYVPSNPEQLLRPQLAWPLDYEDQHVQLGFDHTAIHSGGNLKRLWDALKFSDERRLELEQSAKDAMVRLPEWPAGNVILLVCALSVSESGLDHDRIQTLVDEMCEAGKPEVPEAVAYNLTQLLRQRGERLKRAAVKLLETSLKAVPEKERNVGRHASIALLDLYMELKESKEGLDFLRRSVLESPSFNLNDQDCDAREFHSRLAAGYFFPLFGRPLASLQVLNGLAPEQEAQNSRHALNSRLGSLEKLRTNAIKGITSDRIVEELKLAAGSEPDRSVTAIDLPTSLSVAQELRDRRPVCHLLTSIVSSNTPDLNAARELSGEVAISLRQKHPDLSLIVLATAMVLQSNDKESIGTVLSALDEYIDRGGLFNVLPNETAVDFYRRRNALISLSVLASLDSNTATTDAAMARLTETSLACARRNGDRNMVIAILNQRVQWFRARGDQAAVNEVQKELEVEHDAQAAEIEPQAGGPQVGSSSFAEQLKSELRRALLKSGH